MKKSSFFWVGYADLMTSLFFIMLILYIVSFVLYKKELGDAQIVKDKLQGMITELDSIKTKLIVEAEKAKIIAIVENNLEPLKKESDLFVYDKKYKRFNLAFDVQFAYGKSEINNKNLEYSTINELSKVGETLKNIIEKLRVQKMQDDKFKDISYLIVVSGSASDYGEEDFKNYLQSYERAYYLYQFWKVNGIDLDAKKYHDLLEFQIAGNGVGGVGRYKDEKKNQRFIINIIPKIGEIL